MGLLGGEARTASDLDKVGEHFFERFERIPAGATRIARKGKNGDEAANGRTERAKFAHFIRQQVRI